MNFRPLGSEGRPDAPRAEPVCDSTSPAMTMMPRASWRGWIHEIGFAPIDTGNLHAGRGPPAAAREPSHHNNPMRAEEAEAAVTSSR